TRGHVHPIAVDVAVLHDHIAEIDSDAEFDALLAGNIGVAIDHPMLHLDRAAYRFDRAGELHQHAIARRLHDASLMLGDFGVDQLASMRHEPLQRALFIGADQTRITRDIRGENGGEPALHDNPAPKKKTNPRCGTPMRPLSNNQPVRAWEGRRCNRAWPALPAMQASVGAQLRQSHDTLARA